MNRVTIREAYESLSDQISDREEMILSIMEVTGSTRSAVVRKLGVLTDRFDNVEELVEIAEGGDLSEVMDDDGDPEDSYDSSFEREITTNDSVNLALLKENQWLKKQINKRNLERGSENLLLQELSESLHKFKPSPMVFKTEKNSKKAVVSEVWHLTDWHIGSYSNVKGFNQFNYKIACERINKYLEKTLEWTYLHRNNYIVNELVILCTGDLISGDIHEELLRTNEFSCPQQCVKASELISHAVATAAPHFQKVRVEFIVADNHSRVTKKPQFEDCTNNYNYLVGYMAKNHVKDLPNVQFNLYPVLQEVITVQKMKYLTMHGNTIRGFGGLPFLGIIKNLGREAFYRMNMDSELHFDKIVLGHYHTSIHSTEFNMGASLSGDTGFDRSCSRHSRAAQTAWLVHDKHEFDFTEFRLDE